MPSTYNIYEHLHNVRLKIESRTNALNEFHSDSSLHFTPYSMKTMVQGNKMEETSGAPLTPPPMSIDELTKSLVGESMAKQIIPLQKEFIKITEDSKEVTDKLQKGGSAQLLDPKKESSELIQEMVNALNQSSSNVLLKSAKTNKDLVNKTIPKLIENVDKVHETWSQMFYRWGGNLASGASWLFTKSKEFMRNILTFNFSKEGVAVTAVIILLLWWVLSALGLVASIGSVVSSVGTFIMEWIGSPLLNVGKAYWGGMGQELLWTQKAFTAANTAMAGANTASRAVGCFGGGGGVGTGSMLAAKVVGSANPAGLALTGLWTGGCLIYAAGMGAMDSYGYSSQSLTLMKSFRAYETQVVRWAVNTTASVVLFTAYKRKWIDGTTVAAALGYGQMVKQGINDARVYSDQIENLRIKSMAKIERKMDAKVGVKPMYEYEVFKLNRKLSEIQVDKIVKEEDKGKQVVIGKRHHAQLRNDLIMDKKFEHVDKMNVGALKKIVTSKRKPSQQQMMDVENFLYMNGVCKKTDDLSKLSKQEMLAKLDIAEANKDKRSKEEEEYNEKKAEGLSIEDIRIGDKVEFIHLNKDEENPKPGVHSVTSKSAKRFGVNSGKNKEFPRKWRKVIEQSGEKKGWGWWGVKSEVPTLKSLMGESMNVKLKF